MVLTPDNGIVWDTINTVKAAGTNGYLIYVYTTDDGCNIHGDYDILDKFADVFSDSGDVFNIPLSLLSDGLNAPPLVLPIYPCSRCILSVNLYCSCSAVRNLCASLNI